LCDGEQSAILLACF